jgi:hypothetical protein
LEDPSAVFAQADGFDALIVQPIILRQIVANNFCASFGEQAQLVAIALFVRAGNHTENKLIFLEILPDPIEGLFPSVLRYQVYRIFPWCRKRIPWRASDLAGGRWSGARIAKSWTARGTRPELALCRGGCGLRVITVQGPYVYDKRFAMIRVMSSCCSWGEKARTSATMEVSRECGGCSRWRRRDSTKRSSPNSWSQWSMDSVTPSV